jgi:hypothetical protein
MALRALFNDAARAHRLRPVHGSRLHEWISDRPDELDEKAAGEIVAAIQAIANR